MMELFLLRIFGPKLSKNYFLKETIPTNLGFPKKILLQKSGVGPFSIQFVTRCINFETKSNGC